MYAESACLDGLNVRHAAEAQGVSGAELAQLGVRGARDDEEADEAAEVGGIIWEACGAVSEAKLAFRGQLRTHMTDWSPV